MKRFLLLTIICVSAFSACTKDDGGGDAPKRKTSKTEIIPIDADFRHIALDYACVMALDWQFDEFCDKEGISQRPEIDFLESGVIAITGIAPAEVESFDTEMYVEAEECTLNIAAKVSSSNCVKPSKWNLLLKIPTEDTWPTRCNITYDMQFDAGQVPDESYISASGDLDPIEITPVTTMEDTYAVFLESENADALKAAVNADENCMIIQRGSMQPSGLAPESVPSAFIDPYATGQKTEDASALRIGAVLKNCDYEKIIAPLGDKIMYCGSMVGSRYEGMEKIYIFQWPYTQLKVKQECSQTVERILDYMDFLYSADFSTDEHIFYVYQKSTSEINIMQLRYMLASQDYLLPFYLNSFYYMNAYTFDTAEKQMYE